MSVTGLTEYARARIELHDQSCPGAILQQADTGRRVLFVLREDANRVGWGVTCALWSPSVDKLQRMRSLRAWSAGLKPPLYGDALIDYHERDLWRLADPGA